MQEGEMTEGSYLWKILLRKKVIDAASVSNFAHVPLSRTWLNIIVPGMLVEVKSPDCTTCNITNPCCFWIAAIIKVSGYMGLLRYEGFDSDDSMDLWVNLCKEPNIHPIGWCAENGMPLVPPKCIEDKHTDWKEYLVRRISRVRTIPIEFASKVKEFKHSILKKGMRVEAVDKNLISTMRVASVKEVIGGRLHLVYENAQVEDEEFWCHERSSLVHPVGWSQLVGHQVRATPEYTKASLSKTLCRTFETKDFSWDMIDILMPPASNCIKSLKFAEGMKLEAIDPLNLSCISVSTITKVLKNSYLMIGVDGTEPPTELESFCYHASSPCIFPIGFCESNGLELTPPKGYKGEFKWQEYLKKTKSKSAPTTLFYHEPPNHGFKEGMYLEAVDVMEPKLICVAHIAKVIGRLLRIHFEGWEDSFDQWCDFESPDIYPIGWCEAAGYKLESPRDGENKSDEKDSKKLQKTKQPTRKRGRKSSLVAGKKNMTFSSVTIKTELDDSDCNPETGLEEDSNP